MDKSTSWVVVHLKWQHKCSNKMLLLYCWTSFSFDEIIRIYRERTWQMFTCYFFSYIDNLPPPPPPTTIHISLQSLKQISLLMLISKGFFHQDPGSKAQFINERMRRSACRIWQEPKDSHRTKWINTITCGLLMIEEESVRELSAAEKILAAELYKIPPDHSVNNLVTTKLKRRRGLWQSYTVTRSLNLDNDDKKYPPHPKKQAGKKHSCSDQARRMRGRQSDSEGDSQEASSSNNDGGKNSSSGKNTELLLQTRKKKVPNSNILHRLLPWLTFCSRVSPNT